MNNLSRKEHLSIQKNNIKKFKQIPMNLVKKIRQHAQQKIIKLIQIPLIFNNSFQKHLIIKLMNFFYKQININ